MISVSKMFGTAPAAFSTPLQQAVYETLDRLRIPYFRVDTDEAITMEDCAAIDARFGIPTVKTLFLCNRQQTAFYQFIMPGDKLFRTKDFSSALDVARVSFAPEALLLSVMGTKVGASTVFSALLPSAREVRIVFDRQVADSEWYGCSDGTTTGYMKLHTADLLHRFLPETGHSFEVI